MLLRFNNRVALHRHGFRSGLHAFVVASALLGFACSSSGPVVKDVAQGAEAGARLVAVVPATTQVAYDHALQALIAEDRVEAELRLEQFVLEHPDFVGPYVNLAILYVEDGRVDDADAALAQALAINPDHPAANNQLGMLLRQRGRFADAEQAYAAALRADPRYALAHHNLAILLDLYLHRPGEALSHYQAYQDLQTEPDTTVARWIIDLQRRLGTGDSEARLAQGEHP